LNYTNIHSEIKTFLTALAFLSFQCCSPLTIQSPVPALNEERVLALVSAFSAQESVAKTLFFSGTLTFKNQDTENAVQILMITDASHRVDTKSWADTQVRPYGRMKIEITHPWGKPLTHILIEGQRLHILDFVEKRIYRGSLNSEHLSRRIPVPLNHSILWSLARAFPALLKHQKAESMADNQFTLLDKMGNKVQHFELYSAEPFPRRVCFCKQNATIDFSDFEDDDGILYAQQVHFHDPDHKVGLEIDIDQMTFNTPLPKAVFSMEAPPDFKTVHLKDDDPEH
jgi:hypothetical protein